MSYPTSVQLYAAHLALSPVDFDQPDAVEFLTRHRSCYVEERTLISRKIIRTEHSCDREDEHDAFWHPALCRAVVELAAQ